ncbi:MAG: SdpI family protein [Flavobacteriaceae bacterium]|nr:SdpI family protein [Flavobacteriaceae bacterium]
MLLKIFLISLNIFIIYPLPSILFLSGGIFYLAALVFSKFPPKKINYLYGYRTKASMKSQESWNFSQNYTSKKMKYISLYIFIIGAFSSFLNIELMWSLWLGIIISILMPVLMILEVEKELKTRYPKE